MAQNTSTSWWVIVSLIIVGCCAITALALSAVQMSAPRNPLVLSKDTSSLTLTEKQINLNQWSPTNADYTGATSSLVLENHVTGNNGDSTSATKDVGLAPTIKLVKAIGDAEAPQPLDSNDNYRAGQWSSYAYLDGNSVTPYRVANIYATATKNSAIVFQVLGNYSEVSPLILDNSGAYINGQLNVSNGITLVGTLKVTGNITASGTVTPNMVSDARFKQNISDYKGGLDVVKAMKPVSFQYVDKMDLGSDQHLGVLAQDVLPLVPEAVKISAREDLGVSDFHILKPDQLIFVLINAVKELSAQVDQIRSHINA